MQISSRTILQEATVQQEIKIAYQRFALSVPRKPANAAFQWRPPTHRCTADCDFFYYKDVVICKEFANFHYCTELTCDRLIRTSERQVCPLSGMSYDLALELNPYADYHGNEDQGSGGGNAESFDVDDEENIAPENDYDVDTDIKPAHSSKKAKTEHEETTTKTLEPIDLGMRVEMLQEQEEEEEEAMASKAKHEKNEPEELDWRQITQDQFVPENAIEEEKESEDDAMQKKQARIDAHNTNTRMSIFESLLLHMFSRHVNTHRGLFRTIALNAERLWKLVQASDTIARKKHRYQVEYHLLVVVHNMCHGYNCMQYNIVPFNPFVEANTPQVRDLKRLRITKSEVKVKNFTQTGKLFKTCIAELVQHRGKHKEKKLSLQWEV